MKPVACIFCDIVAGRAPAAWVARSGVAVALVDPRRAQAGHVLVIPTRHVERFHELDDASAGGMMSLAVRVAAALQVTFDPEGLSLWQSNGAAAGQEVPHVHLHLMPRTRGDGLLQVYPGTVPPPDAGLAERERVAARLRAALGDH
ncbi:HIT family protein [Luteimonas abyssi]|uniref:HIT family protein n=1 Tax=Luteimonas abyssi TaxID=1247514 RepID=UPI000737BFB5|nr:HIT domain-containing protein [Luteimonas abyssi]